MVGRYFKGAELFAFEGYMKVLTALETTMPVLSDLFS